MEDLSLHILDLAQNSISAKASFIELSVIKDSKACTLQVMIRDNGCGMTEEQAAKAADPFYTTRPSGTGGMGLPLFRQACQQTGGTFTLRSEEGKGTCVNATFFTGSPNCKPLGAIEDTVYALIRANAQTDFLYTARCDERETVTDTREFRAILEGIPLDAPEVDAFIRNYLKENSPFRNS